MMKKIISRMTLALCLIFLLASVAQAGWYFCSIDEFGVTDNGIVYLKLTDTDTVNGPAFETTYFKVPMSNSNQMLATIMAASAQDKVVKVKLSGVEANSTASVIFVANN